MTYACRDQVVVPAAGETCFRAPRRIELEYDGGELLGTTG